MVAKDFYRTVTISSFASEITEYGLFTTIVAGAGVKNLTVEYRPMRLSNVKSFGGIAITNNSAVEGSTVKFGNVNMTTYSGMTYIGGLVAKNNGSVTGYRVNGGIVNVTSYASHLYFGGVIGSNTSSSGDDIEGNYSEEGVAKITLYSAMPAGMLHSMLR